MPLGIDDLPVKALGQGLKTVFHKAYSAAYAEGVLEKVCTSIKSKSDSEAYTWLGSLPKVREFIGERQARTLEQHSYELKNKTWESTITVLRSEIEDDRVGQIKVRVQSMAADAQLWREELLASVLEANGTCYDGKAFFATDHPVGGGNTQSNTATTALSAANLKAARLAIAVAKDSQGRLLNLRADYLLVPPALEDTAAELLQSDYRPDDGTNAVGSMVKNTLRGKMDYGVSGYITDANSWYVFCTNRPIKPLIFQDRVPVEFGALEGESESGYIRDQFFYGTRQRCNIGYGMWQMAFRSTGVN